MTVAVMIFNPPVASAVAMGLGARCARTLACVLLAFTTGCVWAPTRSSGLRPVGVTARGSAPAVAAVPVEMVPWDPDSGAVNPAALVDAKPKPARPDNATPDPGMPTVKVLNPKPDTVPEDADPYTDYTGELPVYELEAPPAPAASALALKQVISSTLPLGVSGLSGVVRNMYGPSRPAVAGAWVVVVSAADHTKRAERQTDAKGRYRLSGISPGGYFVLASLGAGGVRVEPQYIVLPDGEVGNVNFAVYKR
ncbi:MAG: carboxypeptidase-like regulatory domain-containing protein [Candidatus Sericytochromatia bacterium]|nr:carboxypeptidase-like regulatory domain-containing protein [Candidatus Sericytochromatia bacterium]